MNDIHVGRVVGINGPSKTALVQDVVSKEIFAYDIEQRFGKQIFREYATFRRWELMDEVAVGRANTYHNIFVRKNPVGFIHDGTNVTGIIQNSATSQLTLSGNNSRPTAR